MKEEKFPHTTKPLHWQRWGWRGGSFGATEESATTGVQRAKRRDSRTEDRCRPALTSPRGLSAHPTGRTGAGAEARASEVRSQGEDWGWLRDHSLKGATAPRLPGRESGKSLNQPKRQETIVLGCAKRGDSEHHLNGLQRWVRAAAISTDPRDGHETLRLLLLLLLFSISECPR